MSIAVLVITDGRDEYLARTVESLRANVTGPITERWMYDDTGDNTYQTGLVARFPEFGHLGAGRRLGFGGAIRHAWGSIATQSQARYLFHVENDFRFVQPVDLGAMMHVLDGRSYLAQMALRRQPWSSAERGAGGVVELNPDAYVEQVDIDGHVWLEHRLFWTTNPALFRLRRGTEEMWPEGPESEGRYGLQLLANPAVRMGYWGSRQSGVWVEHIGHHRNGEGY